MEHGRPGGRVCDQDESSIPDVCYLTMLIQRRREILADQAVKTLQL